MNNDRDVHILNGYTRPSVKIDQASDAVERAVDCSDRCFPTNIKSNFELESFGNLDVAVDIGDFAKPLDDWPIGESLPVLCIRR